MNKMNQMWVVALLANLCCALWGSAFPCVKTGYEWLEISRTCDQILFAGLRFTLAGIQLWVVYLLLNRKICRLEKALLPGVFRLGMVQTFVQYFFFYIGVSNTTGVKGSIINSANSFFVILLAHFFSEGERLNMRKTVGCLLGVAGVIAVNMGGDFSGGMTLTGEGFILVASLAYGMASIMAKKLTHERDPLTITCYNFLLGGSGLLLTGFLLGGRMPVFTGKSFLLLFYMGVISAGAFTIWTLLLKYNPVGRVAVFGFMIPVYGCLFSGLFLGERVLKPGNLAALVLVCCGIVVVNFRGKTSGQKLT
ncbi:MAG: DMT family transporter [Clostridiales bacterium]|nr:DMT family transporter [Clostridiales bacterium]